VSKLNGELVQISISHEDLRQSLEEQEASYLKLQGQDEETRQSLEGEKKQVEGKFVFARLSLVDSFFWDSLPTCISLSVAFRPADRSGNMTSQAEATQAAYNSSQQELDELRAAALETCQEVEEGEAQAGSSLVSRLRALGGHVSRRMCRALHLGVHKALGVVGSHYQVDFEAVASGYVVPIGVEMKWRWSARTRLPPLPPGGSRKTSWTSCSPTLLTPASPKPEDHWASSPFFV
jgi:hypothetical protein